MIKSLFLLSLSSLFIFGCSDEQAIPKPPTYLRLDLPKQQYKPFNDNCNYTFEINTIYKIKSVTDNLGPTCHKEIDLGPLNGVINFSYIDMVEPLSAYVNYSIDKVEDHKIKASEIIDEQIIRPQDKVYGTFFELKGDVASPFQFYLTDSNKRFVNGVIYFNSVPNYDSLKPSLEYLKQDLKRLMKTFKWKN